MLKHTEESVALQGTTTDTPAGGEISIKERVDAYTDLQQDRFYGIYHIYGVVALLIVDYYSLRKLKGVWERFLETSTEVNNSSGETRAYYAAVTAAFILNAQYTNYDIITTIIRVRGDLKLPPLDNAIPKTCLDLFETLFLVNEVQEKSKEGSSKYSVYTPVVALLVQK